MTINIQILNLGIDTGPFNLYSNQDVSGTDYITLLGTATRQNLIDGYLLEVPNTASIVRIISTDTCTNSKDLSIHKNIEVIFDPGGSINAFVTAIIIQEDNKIVISGGFTTYDGAIANRMCRLNPNGSIDTSFTTGIGPNSTILGVQILSSGKMIIVGPFSTYQGVTVNGICRIEANGDIDLSFNVGGSGCTGLVSPSYVQEVLVTSSGKIMVGGKFNIYNGITTGGLIRLLENGALDTSFITGTGLRNSVAPGNMDIQTIIEQPDNKIVVNGLFDTYNEISVRRVIRLNTDGSLDNTFTYFHALNGTYLLVILPDGKFMTQNSDLIRINSDGSQDNTFTAISGITNTIWRGFLQSDGKIVLVGYFTTYNSVSKNRIVRINSDGTIDNTFIIGTGLDAEGYEVDFFSDGSMLVGGQFLNYNGVSSPRLLRIDSLGGRYMQ